MGRTVIFGGSFDPIHNSHIEIIKELLRLNDTERVLLMPAAVSPWKEAGGATCAQRFEMCRLAIGGLDRVTVSDIEIKRGGKSYTIDTIREVKKLYPGKVAITCGGDMTVKLDRWYKYDSIIKEAEIIAFGRVGIENALFTESVKRIREDGGKVTVIESRITDVSSTKVRNGLLTAVPENVYDYIMENNLYGAKK